MTLKENPLYILKRMHFKVGRVISHQIILMTKRRILGKNDFWILKCKDPERDHFQWYKAKIKKIFRLFGFKREWEERK